MRINVTLLPYTNEATGHYGGLCLFHSNLMVLPNIKVFTALIIVKANLMLSQMSNSCAQNKAEFQLNSELAK